MGTKEALYKLLRIAIGNEDDLSLPPNVSFLDVMELSETMGVNGLIVSGFQLMVDNGLQLKVVSKEDRTRLRTWVGLSMRLEQKSLLQWQTAQKLVDLFSRNGLLSVGLKGMTVAQWYPNPMHRSSTDFDCILLKQDPNGKYSFAPDEGDKLIESMGISVDRNIYVHSVFDYKGLMVENHHYLAAVKLSERHRKMDGLLRGLLVEEPLQPVMESRLMSGSPMFNAVFLTHHAHRHFLNEYMPMKLLCDWALFIAKNPSLDWNRYWHYAGEFGMLRFAQSMTRLSLHLLGASVPFELPADEEADGLLEGSLWDIPSNGSGGKSLFKRRLGIISKLLHARRRYKVFYDCSSLQMIVAYVKGYFFGGEE